MNEAAIRIDKDFARIGAKSYAVNKINSVEVKAKYLHGPGPMILSGFAALVCVIVAINTANPAAWVIATALCGLTFFTWQAMKVVEYTLLLTTSSKEVAALKSRDRDIVDQLRDEIESAIASRG